jgi:hypothetical protein
MITLIYAAIAIAFLILVRCLSRRTRSHEPDECIPDNHPSPSIGNWHWLQLSERIFDPSDARWLAEELAFPKLANALILGRKRLAIRWLEALQASFHEVVRTPELTPSEAVEASAVSSWQMLWLTLRFKLLVSYALVVVKLFGPYHRLIPSISYSWFPFARRSGRSYRRPAWANSRITH